jgi:hypothetical protein
MTVPVEGLRVEDKLLHTTGDVQAFAAELEQAGNALPRRINANPDGEKRGWRN